MLGLPTHSRFGFLLGFHGSTGILFTLAYVRDSGPWIYKSTCDAMIMFSSLSGMGASTSALGVSKSDRLKWMIFVKPVHHQMDVLSRAIYIRA